jgi:hypothetical protein
VATGTLQRAPGRLHPLSDAPVRWTNGPPVRTRRKLRSVAAARASSWGHGAFEIAKED